MYRKKAIEKLPFFCIQSIYIQYDVKTKSKYRNH